MAIIGFTKIQHVDAIVEVGQKIVLPLCARASNSYAWNLVGNAPTSVKVTEKDITKKLEIAGVRDKFQLWKETFFTITGEHLGTNTLIFEHAREEGDPASKRDNWFPVPGPAHIDERVLLNIRVVPEGEGITVDKLNDFEQQILRSRIAYPTIHVSRMEILDHLFCVGGNGYDWHKGRLVAYDKDINKQKLKQIPLFQNTNLPKSFYPIWKSADILNMPKDIRPEWRAGIIETLHAVVRHGMTPIDPLADSTFDDRENIIQRADFLSKTKDEQDKIRENLKKNMADINDLLKKTNNADAPDDNQPYHMDYEKINHDNMLLAQEALEKLGLKYDENS